MPPKKGQRKTLADDVRGRRVFQYKRVHCPRTLVETQNQDYQEDLLFTSQFAEPKFHKPVPRRKKEPALKLPDISHVESSGDEGDEHAVNFHDLAEDDAEKMEEMIKDQLSIDDVSLDILDKNGVRVKVVNGKVIGPHENQPDENCKPAIKEDYHGVYPSKNKPHKKQNHFIKPKPVVETKKTAHPVTKETIYEQLCKTIRNDNVVEAKKSAARKNAPPQVFRVFGTPDRLNLKSDDRLSIFSYTPIRGNQTNFVKNAPRISTFADFSPRPQNASTPIEKVSKNRKIGSVPCFDISRVSDNDDEEEAISRRLTSSAKTSLATAVDRTVSQKESTLTANEPTLGDAAATEKSSTVGDDGDRSVPEPEKSADESNKSENESDETPVPTTDTIGNATVQDATGVLGVDAEPIQTSSMYRKAETSMTDMLDELEEEQRIPDESYTKKRKRTKSPETMCQGTSTIMSVQDTEEKEIAPGERKRATLQPQKQQLIRESRLSTMTTASSRRESINSLMEDMSIGFIDDDDDLLLMRTHASEGTTRLESRNQVTAMTIRNDDPLAQPFYLDGMSFEIDPSDLKSLLFVAGQTEPKPWTSLPKGALDGRKVKKLGEGSYGEVYSTKWDNTSVAIKVVPFEEDEDNRKYHGEYHSGEMQIARAVLPELIIMKELSNLSNTELDNSTPNFINLISTVVVQGVYPKGLLKAWNTYNDCVKESLNTSPDVYASKDQNFMLFVTENGGVALEDFELRSEDELRSIILQLMLSMQAAENALEFEHRDLHLGNVLIDRNGVEELTYKIKGFEVKIHAKGVKVNIIDFTLGRIRKDGSLVYLDLESDPDLFLSEGDPQYDVYRKMRAHCGGDWTKFEKKSNLMWIEFLANQLIDNETICPPKLLTKKRKDELRQLIRQLGEYESCSESFIDPPFYNQLYKDYMK